MKRPRDFDALTVVFVRAYECEHDIEAALRICFEIDDRTRTSAALAAAALVRQRPPRRVSDIEVAGMRAAIADLAAALGLAANQITGAGGTPVVTAARHAACAQLLGTYSARAIGTVLGISHTAVRKGAAAAFLAKLSQRAA